MDRQQFIKGLLREEVCCILGRLNNEERIHWLVWREDWDEWKVVTSFPDLFQLPERKLNHQPPLVPLEYQEDPSITEIKKLYESNNLDESLSANAEVVAVSEIPDLDVEVEEAEFIQRAYERLNRSYVIIIESKGNKFQTSSVNISVGGILLADPLPEWVFGYCTITIIKTLKGHKQESVQLTCSIVENQPPHRRYRVALSPLKRKEDRVKLHNWLSTSNSDT